MEIVVPDPALFGAALVVNDLPSGQLATVVVKQSYDLQLGLDGVWSLTAANDPARHEIVFEDQIATITTTSGSETEVIGYRPIREADIAPEKSHTDIAILGLGSSSDGGAVWVDGAVWMTRQARSYANDRDARENLFGFQAKGTTLRAIGSTLSEDYPAVPLPEVAPPQVHPDQPIVDAALAAWEGSYNAHFNNFHRRGDGFSFLSSGPALTGNQIIDVFQTPDASDSPRRYALPDLSLTGRYRFHSGHCPDQPHRWAFVWLDAVAADTIVIDIDNARAFVLWRASWSFTDQPEDAYRKIEILKEAV